MKACQHTNVAYRLRDNSGKKVQALLTAPKPDKRPRMTVPSTMSRDNADATSVTSDEASAVGRGINDKRMMYMTTGVRVTSARDIVIERRAWSWVNESETSACQGITVYDIPACDELAPTVRMRLNDTGTRTMMVTSRIKRDILQFHSLVLKAKSIVDRSHQCMTTNLGRSISKP